MRNIEFIQILSILSKKELNDFGLYLQSPYFRQKKALFSLYNAVKKYHPDYSNISEEYLRYSISNGQGKLYSRTFMKKLFSKMNKALIDFLIVRNSRKYIVESGADILSIFTDCKLNFAYLKLFNDLSSLVSKSGFSNRRFLSEYILGYIKFNNDYTTNKIIKKEKFSEFVKLIDRSALNLFYYFLTELVTMYFNSRFISYNSNTPFENTLIYKLYNFLNISELSSLEFE
ncbi:MAG: hypothetical protein N2510_09820, partial [Ignavibacteria bacterium]|nr:hypothetical protein [Ignavibacteria bacterium]